MKKEIKKLEINKQSIVVLTNEAKVEIAGGPACTPYCPRTQNFCV
jgi:hypothetical protein